MLYMILCVDKPGSAETRQANRAAHLAYIDGFADRVCCAGPTLTPDAQAMNGSLILIDLEDAAAVERFCAEDPYARAGLFESVTVRPWRRVLPRD